MKIEPYPWLRDYYVDMNKLYTELILEKIENELLTVRKGRLRGYKKMFESKGRDKILLKGEPGNGENNIIEESRVGLGEGSVQNVFYCFGYFLEICTAR